jgi:predicted nucleic acid-binding protein
MLGEFVRDLLEVFEVAGVDRLVVMDALNSKVSDFEDAVQCAAAGHENIQVIVTRNEADFSMSELTVFNPTSFLESLV